MLRDYLALMRPHQYVKNLVVFLPAFFALRITEGAVLRDLAIAFGAFSLLASAVYILNDYLDREEDRQHPEKKDRPLAAGRIPAMRALLLMMTLVVIGVPIFYFLDPVAFGLASGYVFMNILYTFWLKHVPILDITIIALGFLLRIAIGAVAVSPNIPLSMWIELMIFLGALFLGLAKRRDDVLLAAGGREVRKAIHGYNLEFINGAMMIMASVMIVAYISYTISAEVRAKYATEYLYVTVFFVLIGVLRYMQITFVEERSGSPSRILVQDRFLQLTIAGWLIAFVLLIY